MDDAYNVNDHLLIMNNLFKQLLEWICKSRTSFYGDEELDLPWWFGVACWGYAIAGMTLLWIEPEWISSSCRFFSWYRLFAWELILLQSPLSFFADYLNMTNDSIFHPLDRIVAMTSMLLECCKIYTLWASNRNHHHHHWEVMDEKKTTTNQVTIQAYIIAAILALFAFSKSQSAQEQFDRDGFILWHFLWHLYPLLGSVIGLVDYYYYCQNNDDGNRKRQQTYRVEIHAAVVKRHKVV